MVVTGSESPIVVVLRWGGRERRKGEEEGRGGREGRKGKEGGEEREEEEGGRKGWREEMRREGRGGRD